MENKSDLLMLSQTVALCHDCGDERIFVAVDDPDCAAYCCTSCDAAVLFLDDGAADGAVAAAVASRLAS